MKATLLRTSSVPVRHRSFVPGSPGASLSGSSSPTTSLRLSIRCRWNSTAARGIRKASLDSDVIPSDSEVFLSGVGSRSLTERLPGEVYESESESECDNGVGGVGCLILNEVDIDRRKYAGDLPESGIPVEELEFPGGDGGKSDRSKIRAYYEEMLKSNPTNSLLFRNYGKFLHEVERDLVKAKEYYGRAILASPGDGEVLSLYGKLIWETQRDEDRANSYFEQAVRASPNDCTVLGSYAHFMWEAEEEEEEDVHPERIERESDLRAAMKHLRERGRLSTRK
ncbi:tetratricopeptide repeat (TPR)-like superfamily protein [Actinidia rufa]|uniref:Tetratricopeptide repeat (TPR)-like superfamily protein n=1 Tax=Actinidia rufa TaxID=165716 RepID=A0A7J0DCT1_9ERIC|nr:tetratricopeptide repeat (TPR)-like superfamily protein [Actinidia rufa]